MIIYFSGTGNSKYVAERLSKALGDEALSLNERIRNGDTSPISVDGSLVVVAPTYAWRIPEIVREHILKTEFKGVNKVWFVMTCGGEIGNAGHYNQKLCSQKGLSYMGTFQVRMPENYIVMFTAPPPEKVDGLIQKAEPYIDEAIHLIKKGGKAEGNHNKLIDKIYSGPVNLLFYPFFVSAKKFRVTNNCIGCGKCERVCPLNNITIKDKKPVWEKNCTHCMACINYCPTEAIEYGRKSAGKVRYYFGKKK